MSEQAEASGDTGTGGERREVFGGIPPTISTTIGSGDVLAPPFWGFSHPSIGQDGWQAWFKPCWVYVIASGANARPVKVGISVDVERRIHALEAGNPHGLRAMSKHPVSLGVARQVERRLHGAFADRAMGREWFDMHADEAGEPIPELCRLGEEALAAFRDDILSSTVLSLDAARKAEEAKTFRRTLDSVIGRANMRRRAERF